MTEKFSVSGGFFCRPLTTDAAQPRRSAAPMPIAAAFAAWRNRRVTDASAPTDARAAPLARDEAMPPTEPRYNEGNRMWVASLPGGDYDLVDAGDVVKVMRDGEFVIALPSGYEYSAQDDEGGCHIYSKPAGEPDRAPLSDMPAALGHGAGRDSAMPAALRRHNERMTQLYTPGHQPSDRPRAAADPALTAYATKMKQFWNRGAA